MRATIRLIALLTLAALPTLASDPAPSRGEAADPLGPRFRETVAPFIRTYCVDCHGGGEGKAQGGPEPGPVYLAGRDRPRPRPLGRRHGGARGGGDAPGRGEEAAR